MKQFHLWNTSCPPVLCMSGPHGPARFFLLSGTIPIVRTALTEI
jgi:hypothetical protein